MLGVGTSPRNMAQCTSVHSQVFALRKKHSFVNGIFDSIPRKRIGCNAGTNQFTIISTNPDHRWFCDALGN
jgi:hypothetical protein